MHHDRIRGWRVSSDCSFSDHQYIDFEIVVDKVAPKPFINRRRTDWEMQMGLISRSLQDVPIIENRSDIENAVETINQAFKHATSLSCKQNMHKGRCRPPWWSADIAKSRKETRGLFNEAKKTGNWISYKTSVNRFKNLVRNAKRKSWKTFCSGVEGSSETSRLRKILSSTPPVPSFIQKPCGSWTTSSQETLEVLMATHFPGCQSPENGTDMQFTDLPADTGISINEDKINWAINSFDPYKSPGPDGIIPADLQYNAVHLMPWLTRIYDACLKWSYIPEPWTKCTVVFIPKGGKTSHTKPKDFRPISLSSFLLKTLERIIDLHLRMHIKPDHLSASQHAYMKGKSVETALHSLVCHIEKTIAQGEYTLVAFLDIEGAFNNVHPGSITTALTGLGINQPITAFIKRLLTQRIIISEMGAANVTKVANRGTPQGGVLSPLLWNLALNPLLMDLRSMGFKVIAYADDVSVVVSGKYLDTLSQRMEIALKTLSTWSNVSGLGVNPSKTELVLFTKKYKIPTFTLPRLNGIELKLSDSAKYLGVILDSKLSWSLNTQSRVSKAAAALYSCKRAIGKSWGINPKNTKWLFDMVVKPILLYGALVWWKSVQKDSHRKRFEGILRTSALLITGALRTTPSKALFVMMGWLPIDLMAQEVALNAAIRLNTIGMWHMIQSGHSTILDCLGEIPDNIDYCIAKPSFDRSFSVNIRHDPNVMETILHDGSYKVFTDGSKSNHGVGGGFYIAHSGTEVSFKLPDQCSVLQAELSAIKRAANWLRFYRIYGANIRIYTDSQAALKVLSGVYTTSNLVLECRASLNEMAKHSTIGLYWIPGHQQIPGNTIADSLAKLGSSLAREHTDPFVGIPLSTCKRSIREKLYELAQCRWSTEATCRQARFMWPSYDPQRSQALFYIPRVNLRNLTAVVTGHWPFGLHARRLNLPSNDFCRSCQDEEEEESITHFLCHCPALADQRMGLLGSYFLHDLADLSEVDIRKIDSYIRATNWFGGDQSD